MKWGGKDIIFLHFNHSYFCKQDFCLSTLFCIWVWDSMAHMLCWKESTGPKKNWFDAQIAAVDKKFLKENLHLGKRKKQILHTKMSANFFFNTYYIVSFLWTQNRNGGKIQLNFLIGGLLQSKSSIPNI